MDQEQAKKLLRAQLIAKDSSMASVFAMQDMQEALKTIKGEKGEKGDRGDQGIQGEKGDRGEKGSDGIAGINGINGFNGKDGKDGKNGLDGRQGIPGMPGSPDSPETIADKVNTLEGAIDFKVLFNVPSLDDTIKSLKGKLDISDIKNWNQPAKGRLDQRWHGGGVTTLAGLTDVSISSPTNNQVLKYNSTTGKWENGTGGGGSGITSINSDSTAGQLLVAGSSGSDFAITDNGTGTHTFNIPTASSTKRGLLSSADWTTFNGKGAGDALTANPLSQFAATTSAQLRGVLSDEIGSGVALFNSTPVTNFWVDGNRVDTYTSTGSIEAPFKTIGAAMTAITSAAPAAFSLTICPATYVESVTVSAFPCVINMLGATIVGNFSVSKQFDVYDGVIVGTVTASDASTTVLHAFHSTYMQGNKSITGLVIFDGCSTDTSGVITINASSSLIVGNSNIGDRIANSGTLYFNSGNNTRTDNANYNITSTANGSLVYISNAKIINLGTGGGINISNNAAVTQPNEISSVDIVVGGTTNGITAGSGFAILSDYNIFGSSGQFYATGSNLIPTARSGGILFPGATSGVTTLIPTAVAGTTTLTLPAATDTLVGKATTDTLTNKTLSDSTSVFGNVSDITKIAKLSLGGATAGKTLTLISSHTNDRSLTFPDTTDTLVGKATTDVLTNKTLIATTNVVEEITTTASSATPTPTGGSLRNFFTVTALAAAAAFAAPSGSPANGNYLTIRILDNGTARALTWNAIYRAGTTIALPTTTVLSKTIYIGFRYNSASSTWDLLSVADGF